MKIFLSNAFSLGMILAEARRGVKVTINPLTTAEVAKAEFESVVGHPDTAAVLTSVLGKPVAFNRVNLTLHKEERLIVAQLTNGRLPEGATTLPEGFEFEFFEVKLE